MFGVEATRFKIEQYMEFSPENLIKIVILSILCAFVSILFCITMKKISGIYKKYLSNHDMALWNQNMEAMMKKYDNRPDICGLLIWFGGRVQTLHDKWRIAHE